LPPIDPVRSFPVCVACQRRLSPATLLLPCPGLNCEPAPRARPSRTLSRSLASLVTSPMPSCSGRRLPGLLPPRVVWVMWRVEAILFLSDFACTFSLRGPGSAGAASLFFSLLQLSSLPTACASEALTGIVLDHFFDYSHSYLLDKFFSGSSHTSSVPSYPPFVSQAVVSFLILSCASKFCALVGGSRVSSLDGSFARSFVNHFPSR